MNLTKVFKEAFTLFIEDILPLIVASLIFCVLTPLTFGILGGPLLAGLYKMVLSRVRDDQTPQIGDVFNFDHFGRYVGAFYALAILIGIGFALLIVPGLYLTTIWFYVFLLMVDRGLGLTDAMGESKRLVERNGLGPHFGLVFLLALIGGVLGKLTWLLGTLAALPFTVCCAVVSYDALETDQLEPPSSATVPQQPDSKQPGTEQPE